MVCIYKILVVVIDLIFNMFVGVIVLENVFVLFVLIDRVVVL